MTLPPPALFLDGASGVQLPSSAADWQTGVALGSVQLVWGRRTTRERIEPSTLTFDFRDPTGEWSRTEFYVGRRVIISNLFSGRITDLRTRPVRGVGQVATITATDVTAEWANLYIGSPTYPMELARDRVLRMMTATGLSFPATNPLIWPFGITAYDPVFNPNVRTRDIDRRSFRELLDEIGDTIDSVVTTAGGDRVVFRPNSINLTSAPPDVDLAAGQVEIDSEYVQTVADIATRVGIGYWSVDSAAPEERTRYYTRESARALYGERSVSLRTERYESITAPETTQLANLILDRMSSPLWRMPSIRTRESLMDSDAAMTALLAAVRKYQPAGGETLILIRDVPATVPVPESNAQLPGQLYLRLLGGTYSHDGRQWHVLLHGARSARVAI